MKDRLAHRLRFSWDELSIPGAASAIAVPSRLSFTIVTILTLRGVAQPPSRRLARVAAVNYVWAWPPPASQGSDGAEPGSRILVEAVVKRRARR